MKKPLVGIVMGSDSDWPLVTRAHETLNEFDIGHEVHVISAHRSPDIAIDYACTARPRGLKVIIAAAGGAAHLAGIIAAHTSIPVIGIPIQGGALNGIDSLLSTAQMPAGIPVATVTLGSAGGVNAAILAAQIIATADEEIATKLEEYKKKLNTRVRAANDRIQAQLKTKK
ncbi:MAG: 5-(carboxyamino)imidazole ribonucleotide mutase [Lentisphaerae bacterium]|jgi:phosphoribosylaminoimidazole carboxylase PurE protein|nr:5-(carboxyamino)imidazole ribonucleotide mutase [Lentisphaerota bacterium]